MSSLEQEIKQVLDSAEKLKTERQQLEAAAEKHGNTSNALLSQCQNITQSIDQLIAFEDPAQQENIGSLRKELTALQLELTRIAGELKELNEKLDLNNLALANCLFQSEILSLWQKEEYYSKFLDENGLSSHEALLKTQGYSVPNTFESTQALTCLACDYARIGRQDIVDLLTMLIDPDKRTMVFLRAKTEYDKSPDYNFGLVLSLCYKCGYGTEIDKKASFEICWRFAAENHPLALCSAAFAYFDGDICEVDKKKAVEYYQRATAASQQSFYVPHYVWGQRLLEGDDLEKDEAQGIHFLKIADNKGIHMATGLLAVYYANKIASTAETPENAAEIKQAKEQYFFYARKADESKSMYGKYFHALCYSSGCGVPQDNQRYLEMLQQSAAAGFSTAIGTLAAHYHYGYLLPYNPIQALKLYFEMLRRNSLVSMSQFKTLLANNTSNPEFQTTAYDLCKKCLEGHLLDNPLDSTVMGLFYQQGILVTPNLARAKVCFQKGADLGAEEAAAALVLLAQSENSLGLISFSEAQKYLSYASSANTEVTHFRHAYRTHYMPLFNTLKAAWPEIGLGSKWSLPDGITQLIADYAITNPDAGDRKENGKESTSKPSA